ncbi:hypothetical protein [Amycolatopsis sp. NPDC059657]|uniref:hypothetical protein n=1 Tax=Amycolatopsis sp. NPDC059657 TaxID=3346899 RepID=UPI00366ECED5
MLVSQGKRGQLAALACLLAAGCSATTPGQPAVPPPGQVTRALVTWADTLCLTTTSLERLQAEASTSDRDISGGTDPRLPGMNALNYLDRTASSVEYATKSLKELQPSRIAEADAHVAGLLKALDGLKLPPSGDSATRTAPDDQKLAKAKQVATAVGTLGKPRADLDNMVKRTPAIVTSYDLAPACAPVGPSDAPKRVLVGWADTLCLTTKAVEGLRVDGSPISDDPRFAQFAGAELAHAIGSASTQVTSIAQPLGALTPTGIPEADAFKADLLAALEAAKGQLPQTSFGGAMDQPIAELKSQLAKASAVLDSVKPKAQGLPALAGRLPQLAAAYDLAPRCTPLNAPPPTPTPLPAASNGTDVKACESGKCQVEVSGTVEFTVGGHKFRVVVTDQSVTVSDDISLFHLSGTGEASSGREGKMVHFRLAGRSPTAAVLNISTTA